VGGLVGENENGTIANCYSIGSVSGGTWEIGGLVGVNLAGTIGKSFSTGEVTSPEALFVGGLAGGNNGEISNCYSTGSISGYEEVGGLVGVNGGELTNCYAAGRVEANEPPYGGLIGNHAVSTYLSCFWDSDVNPDMNGIGSGSDPNVIGKTTAEMMQECTFTNVGWDFVEVWDIGEGQTYPFLRVYPAGDLNHDGIVNFADVAILALHWLEGTEP
jgi:hypothetical protein